MENQELPFAGEAFKKAWDEWLQFRKEGKLKKYVPTGLKKTFTMLLNISDRNEETAIKILNQSMEQGWQGLFPLKANNNANTSGFNKEKQFTGSRDRNYAGGF